MIEISENEYKSSIDAIERRSRASVAIPNVQNTNSNLESRQAARNQGRNVVSDLEIEDKVSVPNIREVNERKKNDKNKDVEVAMPKMSNGEPINLSKEEDFEEVSIPDFDEKKQVKEEVNEVLENKIGKKRKRRKVKENVEVG